MGVTGLLPFSKSASRPCSVATVADELGVRTVAADAYCWMHRAAAASPQATLAGDYSHVVAYCAKYARLLLAHRVKPILVFDGRHLPAKRATEEKRRDARRRARVAARDLVAAGRTEEAKVHLRKSIDVTHEMALAVIRECRNMNVDCVVAPYEADAQLAYLNRAGIAHAVVTEDSDLILFGCDKILFKMDIHGNGVLFESAKLPAVMKCPADKFDFDKFRQMCILSGCDYLASLPGIGLAKARQFINSTRDPSISNALRRIPSFFSKSRLQVTDDYRDEFMKAEATFKHQLVYDPLNRRIVPLTDPIESGTDLNYCSNAGEYLENDVAFQLAIGNLDPFSLKKMDDWHPDDPNLKPTGSKTTSWGQDVVAPQASIWHKNYFSNADKHIKVKEPYQTAITMHGKRMSKPKSTEINRTKDAGLTIDDLSSMYRDQTPNKRKLDDSLKIPDSDEDEEENTSEVTRDSSFSELISSISFKDQTNEDTSPVLKLNRRTYKNKIEGQSANKLKKFSQFQRTTLESGDVVESKFFSDYTPDYSSEEIKENVESKEISTIIKKESIIIDERPLKSEKIEEKRETSRAIPLNPFKIKDNVDYVDDNEDLKDCLLAEDLTPRDTQESHIGHHPTKSNDKSEEKVETRCDDSKNNFKSANTKRLGLSKKRSSSSLLPSGQQTLLLKFGFQKRSQLKH